MTIPDTLRAVALHGDMHWLIESFSVEVFVERAFREPYENTAQDHIHARTFLLLVAEALECR